MQRRAVSSVFSNKLLFITAKEMEDLTGKVAIVTGASSGIGEAIARVLVLVGVHVIGLARSRKDLQTVAESLKGNKGTFHSFPGDVRIEEDLLDVFAYADSEYGGIDILVNDAGISYTELVTNSSTDHLRNVYYTNTLAAAISNREAVKYMVKHSGSGRIINLLREALQKIFKKSSSGHIVNIVSNAGLTATSSSIPLGNYQSSKFALHAITENVRQEITQSLYPIKITGIYPHVVDTPIWTKGGLSEDIIKNIPHLEAEDVADAVLFALEAPRNVQINRINIAAISSATPNSLQSQ